MNENINLCKILKGHEGETFYCSLAGINGLFKKINNDGNIVLKLYGANYYFGSNGRHHSFGEGECLLFPSKNQRDWNKWLKEQKPKISKTWSELYNSDNCIIYNLSKIDNVGCVIDIDDTPIEKSAKALLKIHQLIEVGYGGNVTNKEWINDYDDVYVIGFNGTEFRIFYNPSMVNTLAFHTKEQAEEFLRYPENVQLLKDYFMI